MTYMYIIHIYLVMFLAIRWESSPFMGGKDNFYYKMIKNIVLLAALLPPPFSCQIHIQ